MIENRIVQKLNLQEKNYLFDKKLFLLWLYLAKLVYCLKGEKIILEAHTQNIEFIFFLENK